MTKNNNRAGGSMHLRHVSLASFVNRPCLFAAGICFSLALPMVKARSVGCISTVWADSFVGVTVTGVFIGCIDEVMSLLQSGANATLLNLQLGIKCVWVLICIMSMVFVSSAQDAGMAGFILGLLLTFTVLLWSIVDLVRVGFRKWNSDKMQRKEGESKKDEDRPGDGIANEKPASTSIKNFPSKAEGEKSLFSYTDSAQLSQTFRHASLGLARDYGKAKSYLRDDRSKQRSYSPFASEDVRLSLRDRSGYRWTAMANEACIPEYTQMDDYSENTFE